MVDSSKQTYRLSEFAELAGVSTKSLQRWDKNGVLVADRTDGCHRIYTQAHLEQLRELQAINSSKLSRKKNFAYEDLTDQQFGKLHVIERAEDWIGANGHRHIQWLCECECGNKVVVKGTSLRVGYKKSCGCSQYGDGETKKMWDEYYSMLPEDALDKVSLTLPDAVTISKTKPASNHKFQDLTGMVFGFWKVLERAETRYYKNGGQAVCWLCECKCGTIKSVPGRDLKSGASQSCGCMSSMSWLEYYVKQYLDEHGISYEYQKKYSDLQGIGGKLLSYDFVVMDDVQNPICAIECQGEQHYRPIKKFGGAKQLLKQQIHDKLKSKYAADILHIPVYEIFYTSMTQDDVYSAMKQIGL